MPNDDHHDPRDSAEARADVLLGSMSVESLLSKAVMDHV